MFSIGITTYKYRYSKYLIPLLSQIRECTYNEIILGVNGEYKESFSEQYRKNVLELSANTTNLFPFVYPNFRSLAKMWNTLIINCTSDYILILNDDLVITDSNFFINLKAKIREIQTSFMINGSYSHFVIKKSSMTPDTWFDERYLGIGCEDHEYNRRALKGIVTMHNTSLSGLTSFSDPENAVVNQKLENGKYSMFNRQLLNQNLPEESQYPFEQFYLTNYNQL